MSRSFELLSDACVAIEYRHQKMFGGYGFFAPNGGMFAGIVTDDEIIFKLIDEPAKDELIALGGHPWTYNGQHKPMTMAQWIVVPEAFYDDAELLASWAKRAQQLAPAKKVSSKKASLKKAPPKKRKPVAKKK